MAVRHILCLAAFAALALSSCTFPFDPGIETTDSRIVVEGSISIGGTSSFSFSRVFPFTTGEYNAPAMEMTGYIEGENGVRVNSMAIRLDDYTGYYATRDKVDGGYGGNSFTPQCSLKFDTSKLPADQRYRVHFDEKITGAVYESDWLEVCQKPVIDELRYILNYDREEMNVALSMHCPGHSHFRWYYEETWEYHSDLFATHYLVPEMMFNISTGAYQPEAGWFKFQSPENRYYCWMTVLSPEVKIFSTEEQAENMFTDLEFHRVSAYSDKLQVMYRLTVHLEAIGEETFRYWQNIEDNTNNQGSIFAPVPSQMTGNIHCISDPSAEVIGYVNASQEAVAVMYFDNRKIDFCKVTSTSWANLDILEFTDFQEFAKWYSRGYMPYTYDEMEGKHYWAKARCVDCRLSGGTKDRPKDWPTDDM